MDAAAAGGVKPIKERLRACCVIILIPFLFEILDNLICRLPREKQVLTGVYGYVLPGGLVAADVCVRGGP